MADVATDLKQRFEWAMDVCLEAYEVLPDGRSFVRSDEDERAIEIFKRLCDTADAIPPSLIASAEELRDAEPQLFEQRVARRIEAVGSDYEPANAADFLEQALANAVGHAPMIPRPTAHSQAATGWAQNGRELPRGVKHSECSSSFLIS